MNLRRASLPDGRRGTSSCSFGWGEQKREPRRRPSREHRGAADALECAGETDLENNPETSGKANSDPGSRGCADRRAAIMQ
jgi:hypothetical protein